MPTYTHTGRFMSVLLCPGQSELACIYLFVHFNNQLDTGLGPCKSLPPTGLQACHTKG